jgi:uncharacterized membrane protein
MLEGRGSMRLPLLILHILAGTVGLLSGTFAIAVRKGSRLHRASGNIFTVAMLTLASSALCLAIMKSQHGNIIGSIITFYMIATAWLAGRRRGIGRLDLAALLVGTGGAVAVITLGVWTLHHPDMVNGHGHDYSGALDESEAYAGSISRAAWFRVQRGQSHGAETDGS